MEGKKKIKESVVWLEKPEPVKMIDCVIRDPDSYDYDWSIAEVTTWEILLKIHPTVESEKFRNDLIEFMRTLIESRLNCEIFVYGSFPLKTYLPDGDIDLTAFFGENFNGTKIKEIRNILEEEFRKNTSAKFIIKDEVIHIDADVKISKCVVQNLVVDISFNQLGGVSTLCFLEKVDCIIGKNHLFKRSILLVKTWCYNESRILGGNFALISTYAMEILVLFIFQLFHKSLDSPLAVLYTFLRYYGYFDWENYGISLEGPIYTAAFPQVVVVPLTSSTDGFLLTKEFLRSFVHKYTVPACQPSKNDDFYKKREMNIIDPLKERNNLGRSIGPGSACRVVSACQYAAKKLWQILSLPGNKIPKELRKFFKNTLKINESGERSDVHKCLVLSNSLSIENSGKELEIADYLADLTGDYESHESSLLASKKKIMPSKHNDALLSLKLVPEIAPEPILILQQDSSPQLNPNINSPEWVGLPWIMSLLNLSNLQNNGVHYTFPYFSAMQGRFAYGLNQMGKSVGTGSFAPRTDLIKHHQQYRNSFSGRTTNKSAPLCIGANITLSINEFSTSQGPPKIMSNSDESSAGLQAQTMPSHVIMNDHNQHGIPQFNHSAENTFRHTNSRFSPPNRKHRFHRNQYCVGSLCRSSSEERESNNGFFSPVEIQFGSFSIGSSSGSSSRARETLYNSHTGNIRSRLLASTNNTPNNLPTVVNSERVLTPEFTWDDADFPPL